MNESKQTKRVTISLAPDIEIRVEEIAEKEKKSLTTVVRHLFLEALNKREQEQEKEKEITIELKELKILLELVLKEVIKKD